MIKRLLTEGRGHLVASMGEATGPVPFSSYMTTPAFLAREPDVIARFTRATYQTQRWLASHGAGDIARAVAPAHVLTANVDETLDKHLATASTISRSNLERVPALIGGGHPFIAKLHGSIGDVSSCGAISGLPKISLDAARKTRAAGAWRRTASSRRTSCSALAFESRA